ncbi:MAG TPA: tetratricopeptide repeat protein [Ignavibacteriaceae bacterium]|nr:tetratricopeptide repeat protein [Ignavibacteriaceae bacterium]
MVSNCPYCNFELDKEYKYCPNCGENLAAKSKEIIEEEFVICGNCGLETKSNLPYCSECGIKLTGKEEKIVRRIDKQEPTKPVLKAANKPVAKKVSVRKENIPQGKKVPHTKRVEDKKNTVEISKPVLIIIAIAIISVIILILSLSGVFSSKNEDTQMNNQMGNVPDLNVQQDLTAMEQQYKSNPENHAILLSIANMAHDAKLYPKAIDNYKKYIEKEPEDVDAIVDLGICYYETGNLNLAIQTMEQGAKVNPRHQKAHFNLGIINLQAGNTEKAKEWFRKAVDIAPNTETGQNALQQLNTLK